MNVRSIPLFKVAMNPAAADAVARTLNSGFIGQGARVEEFEAALRDRIGSPHVLSLNSCTSALQLALHLIMTRHQEGVSDGFPPVMPGDEVLTSALTCTATNWPILANGLRIKWVDVDPGNLNIDTSDILAKLTPTTKVIILVHWGGYPVSLNVVREVQETCFARYGFRPYVIEDCAHSWASTYQGRALGQHGNFCAFSFQAIKHLTSGDGGALVTPDKEFYRRGKLLRWFGIDREARTEFRCEDDIPEFGFKYHMNDINAAIGLSNLEIISEVIARHRANARFYDDSLRGVPGITQVQPRLDDRESSYWIYSLLVENRSDFGRKMAEAGIMVSPVHKRNDGHSCVREFIAPLPALEYIDKHLICIPVGWWVTDEDRAYVIDTIRRGW